jgi:hypothetical protein
MLKEGVHFFRSFCHTKKEHNMKTGKLFLLGALSLTLLLVVMASAFWVGKVYAATGCFPDTDGHWAETFICWIKDNGITSGYGDGTYRPGNYVTRAEMAVFMNRLAEIPPTKGWTVIGIGPTGWQRTGTDTSGNLYYYKNKLVLTNPGTGVMAIQASPDIPLTVYGWPTEIVAAKVCYSADDAKYITTSALYVFGSFGNEVAGDIDYTDRKSWGCFARSFDPPVSLSSYKIVTLYLEMQFDYPSSIAIYSADIWLRPSGSTSLHTAGFDELDLNTDLPAELWEGTDP